MEPTVFIQQYVDIMRANRLDEFATEELAEKFFALTERMLEVNEHMNLTAIREVPDIIAKHYADSLMAAKYLPQGARVIDIGCGAGFPSLPLAIARPDVIVTALDSTAKRVNYISETAKLLGLDNILTVTARAEEMAKNASHRERYDVATARAVARLNVLCELCLGYVKVGGCFISMKAELGSELDEAHRAISAMGGKLEAADTISLKLPDGVNASRTIVTIRKKSSTPPNYPRNNSQITKKPL